MISKEIPLTYRKEDKIMAIRSFNFFKFFEKPEYKFAKVTGI